MDDMNLEGIISRRSFLRGFGIFAFSALGLLSEFGDVSELEAKTRKIKKPNSEIRRIVPPYAINRKYELSPDATPSRKKTYYIILHNTEGMALGAIDEWIEKRKTHFVLDLDGTVYPIVNVNGIANHAGKSMWDGRITNRSINYCSIGIECVGYNDGKLTDKQYKSLKPLLHHLMSRFKVNDSGVLGHYQVSYNRMTDKSGTIFKQRGRKEDGINIEWKRLGIRHRTYDKDVAAGRIRANGALNELYSQVQKLIRQR